jgi:hypothetical protein
MSRLNQAVEAQLGAPCEFHVAERDLFRAVLVRQPIPQVGLRADDVPLGESGARIATLSVQLDNVTLRGPRRRPEITADGGSFVASFLDDAIEALVDPPPVVERIWLLDDGLRVNMVAGVAVTCDLRLEDSQIVLKPRLPELLGGRLPWRRLGRDVPDLPFGAQLDTLAIEDGRVVASGSLSTEHLRWSAGSTPASPTTSGAAN